MPTKRDSASKAQSMASSGFHEAAHACPRGCGKCHTHNTTHPTEGEEKADISLLQIKRSNHQMFVRIFLVFIAKAQARPAHSLLVKGGVPWWGGDWAQLLQSGAPPEGAVSQRRGGKSCPVSQAPAPGHSGRRQRARWGHGRAWDESGHGQKMEVSLVRGSRG